MVEATLGCLGGEQGRGLAGVGRQDPRGQFRTEAAASTGGLTCAGDRASDKGGSHPAGHCPRLTSMSGMLFRFRGLKM